ncbi:MAG: fumarylacetoacetate hydrolase family protein [Pseudorhodoplanes sp.]|nr:fumarylacetoacetate hydrolase family protein [Pseudorhodoplanes sp.]
MQIGRYEVGGRTHYGILDGDTFRRLKGSPFESLATDGATDPRAAVRLLCPVEKPRLFGVGLNYVSHVREAKAETPKFPMLFMMPDTAACGPGDAIVYPREGKHVDFEAELAVVIGKTARRVPKEKALDVVLGYTCANDVSERTIQFAEMKTGCMLIGKSYDTFCPIGPVIATDLDPGNLDMEGFVNGKRRQSINTSDLLFDVPHLISYISQAVTLLPGDVIITGTPAGVGPILPGDVVDIAIEGIGTLSNPVVAEQ